MGRLNAAVAIRSVANFGRATGTVADLVLERAGASWRESKPSIVLTPTRLHGLGLSRAIVGSGRSLLGLEFFTPALFRQWASGLVAPRSAGNETWRVALAAVSPEKDAERLSGLAPVVADLSNRLTAAGGKVSEVVSLRRYSDLMARAQEVLHEAEFVQPATWDLMLLERARRGEKVIHRLVVSGFSGEHWEFIHLLLAAACLAEEVLFVVEEPRPPSEELDAQFIATLEQWLSDEANPLPDQLPAEEVAITCLAGRNESQEADALVGQCIEWLAIDPAAEIGVMIPERGILSREVSRRLEELGVPHYDSYGRLRPGTLPSDAVGSWAEYQRSGTLSHFSDFLRLANRLTSRVERALTTAFGDCLSTETAVVARVVDPGAAGVFDEFERLPAVAPISDFVRHAAVQFRNLGWLNHLEALEQGEAELGRLATKEIPRAVWLDWFRGICRAFFAVRTGMSGNAFARVVLLRPEEVDSYGWSHVIVAGAVDGVWPPRPLESALLDAREIRQLNRESIDQSLTETGRFGAGHEVVALGRARLLSPRDRIAIERSRFLRIAELPDKAFAVTTHLSSETSPDTPLSPSDAFAATFMEIERQAVTPEALSALALACESRTRSLRIRNEASARYPEVTEARERRIDRSEPFDQFLFAYDQPPSEPIDLPATSWEDLFSRPHAVWLRRIANVSAASDFDALPFRASIGSWAHAWIARCGETDRFQSLPDRKERGKRIRAGYEAWKNRITVAYAEAGQPPPVWWEAAGRTALSLALRMSSLLDSIEGIEEVMTESTLSPETLTAEGGSFRVFGKADLIARQADGRFSVIDFKTGTPKINRTPRFEKGQAIQIALYVFLLSRQLGGSASGWIVPANGKDPIGPVQPDVNDAAWEILAEVGRTGRFGMLGDLRTEYGWAPDVPLAFLPIDKEILQSKWDLTHAGKEEVS